MLHEPPAQLFDGDEHDEESHPHESPKEDDDLKLMGEKILTVFKLPQLLHFTLLPSFEFTTYSSTALHSLHL